MNLSDLGALGEFLGFFGLMATLVYLAVQTRQTKQLAIADSTRSAIVDFQGIWETLGREDEFAGLVRKAVNDWHLLTRNEQLRVHSFFINLTIHLDNAFLQERLLPELKELARGWEDNYMSLLQCPGGRYWYETCHYLLSASVRERVSARLADPGTLPPPWTVMAWWQLDDDETTG